ncbi:MAG: hypothetical protein S4CHLAM6_14810 [Chlamydiae bacterium]|nr:hypothetical protein [Chlamydiota bacterium]
MGLLKKGCITCLITLACISCNSTKQTAMSIKDQDLLNLTIKNSVLAYSTDPQLAEAEAQLQMQVPKNLQQALTFYKQQYKSVGVHDYESLQKIGFKILQEAIFQEDVEAQLLSLYGVDLAKHPKLMPVLEQALDSPYNLVQMTAIQTLSKLPDDKANKLLIKGCSSPFLDVALTTTYILAERRHPEVFGLLESLMSKAPPECTEFFPALLALIDNNQATAKLRKLMSHPNERVRSASIIAAAGSRRTELLSDIRALSKQHNIYLQEACAFALGELHDEASIPTLEQIANSPSESASLAALNALRKLGFESSTAKIEKNAQDGNLFAIGLLNNCSCDTDILVSLAAQNQNRNVALNATLALLQKKDLRCLPQIISLLKTSDPNIVISEFPSAATTLTAKKIAYKTSARTQENFALEQASFALRQKILSDCTELPEQAFLKVAKAIVEADQNDLIPAVINHLIVMKTSNAKELLKEWQQKVGSPYVRAWSNLALLKLSEPGPWKEDVLKWIKKRKYHRLVRLKDFAQMHKKKLINPFEINPMETSQLLLESYLAIAQTQDSEGIEVILDSLANNELKNRYAIAGVLILASQ